eukprot:6320614-Lingulodinium_polyedra.AAC.1
MPKSGVSKRETESMQTNMPSMHPKYLFEKITKHQTAHPSEAGQCWIALQQGWHSSSCVVGN